MLTDAMIPPSPWLALHRELPSVSIDPATRSESGDALLLAGTMVLDGLDILRRADARQLESVTVVVSHVDGWLGFARVETRAFRLAIA
jgi:hypothetical protein